jgi:hypothetical protein
MPTLNRYALSALLVALPLVAAQHKAGDQGPPGGQGDSSQPPAGAPDNASGQQGDDSMAQYAEWYSNDYNCGMCHSTPPDIG